MKGSSPGLLLVPGLALMALAAGCVRYDVPRALMSIPGQVSRGVELSKSRRGYRVTSTTRLNGSATLAENPTVQIASGSDGDWGWVVKAVPSVVTKRRAWLESRDTENVLRGDARYGNWTHEVSGWGLAFRRAHRVARYLLGRQPPALHATLLLLPYGVKYSRGTTRTGNGYFPLTFAFYYWPHSSRFKGSASIVNAVTGTIYEYQHLLVASRIVAPEGKTRGDRTANNEARSQCWSQSTFLALEAGTKAYIEYNASRSRGQTATATFEQSMPQQTTRGQFRVPALSRGGGPRIRFSDAYAWGSFFEIQSLASYLQQRGVQDSKVVANKPSEMNAVLSVCRSMTQHPLDITATNGYPPSQVQFVPFFPAKLRVPSPKVASGSK